MGILVVSDNAATTLASSISNNPSVAALVLALGTKFPVVNHGGIGTDWSYATLFDAAGNTETVLVTRHDSGSSTLSIVRGTAAGILGITDASCLAWASGTTGVACRLIAQTVSDMGAAVNASAASAAASAASAATAAASIFAAGTRMPFAQAAAPTGWTQDVSDNADNRMLRVVNTAGGGVGGTVSHSPILMNVVPNHTHGFSTGTESVDHTHAGWSGGRNADHTHSIGDPGHAHSAQHQAGGWQEGHLDGPAGPWMNLSVGGTAGAGTGIWTGGQSADHAHYTTTGGRSAAHTHSGSTDNGSSATNWAPRYINMIICTKD